MNLLKSGLKSLNEIYLLSSCYMVIILIMLYLADRYFKKILYFSSTTPKYKSEDE